LWIADNNTPVVSSVFYFGEFSQPGDKKKRLANITKGFLRFKKRTRHILTKKLRSRQI
jgi:hypothetical protein